ncbi:Protein FAR1-RELATED SEQUENCE 11 [Bienertia sinuspersici]
MSSKMIDLNELPSNKDLVGFMGEEIDNVDAENSSNNSVQVLPHNNLEVSQSDLHFEPFVGQTFQSEEEVWAFYHNYACLQGFSIKKDRTKKRDGVLIRRDFYCHRSRTQPLKEIDPNKEQRNRVSVRCSCNAHLRIKLRRCNEIFPEEWHVTTFKVEHNHALLSQSQVRFLPANRIISEEDEKQILLYKEAGLTVRQIIRVLELEKNIEHGELPFLEKDIRNLYTRVRKALCRDDVANLLEYFKSCQEENAKFQYVVKLNVYDMPCGILVGINNHGKTIFFGCALLRNETTDTFRWLMKVEVAIRQIIQRQLHDNMLAITKIDGLRVNSPMEKQASRVLTPFAFEKFWEEWSRSCQYSIKYVDGYNYTVKYYANETSRCHIVFWDSNVAMCSCKQFEFMGIICRHILRVFLQVNCHEVPPMYPPIRWHLDESTTTTQVLSEQGTQGFGLIDDNNISCPPKSHTKGRPKNKRQLGGKELGKQTRHCSKCKKPGHYANNCSTDQEKVNTAKSAPRKKTKVATSNENLNPIF